MAELAQPDIVFDGGCPDCGERRAVLPVPLPGVADDFDWRTRDYDGFRLFLMQELAHRFPERRRWTPADMEVVIAELLAAALDRASHALDAVQAERYLETARRPQSVRRLLKLIGYDAPERGDPAVLDRLPPRPDGAPESRAEKLERYWALNPAAMEEARALGPRLIGEQRRMVTLDDHARMLERHPLVAHALARLVWSGAWNTLLLAVRLAIDAEIDTPLHAGPPPADGRPSGLTPALWREIQAFHADHRLALPPVDAGLTARRLLRVLVERYRMIGSEVFLESAVAAPVSFALSVQVAPGFFRSEVRQALEQVFSADQGGFFEPGRFGFGDDLYASDIIEAAMRVEGVTVACLNRMKRVGGGFPDRVAAGFIDIGAGEYVLCENRRGAPEKGHWRLSLSGGEAA